MPSIFFLCISLEPHQVTLINTFVESGHSVRCFVEKDCAISERLLIQVDKLTDKNYALFFSNFNEQVVDILVIAGWKSTLYNRCSMLARIHWNIPCIVLSDTQWKGNLRQYANSLLSVLRIRKYFSHIMVAGVRQYEYARRLGFEHSKILMNALVCSDLFNAQSATLSEKEIVYVGRLSKEKGLRELVTAWRSMQPNSWKLTLIGTGPMKIETKEEDNIYLEGFVSNEDLPDRLRKSSALILPSLEESWGVVLHEAVALGLPVLASSACGAAQHFLINGYNGYLFEPNVASISYVLGKFFNSSSQLKNFSKASCILSSSVNKEMAKAYILSTVL